MSAADKRGARSGEHASPARPAERKELGAGAENRAAAFLEARGFSILARNHRCRRGEVDLVAGRGELIAFVEVRSRTAPGLGSPAETVTFSKRRRVIAAAIDWAARAGVLDSHALRFDVIAVIERGEEAEIDWLEGAFDASGAAT